MNAIKEILSDNDGSLSTIRLVVLAIVAAVLGNWVYLTIHTGQQQTLDWSSITLVLGAMGVKVAQKPFEISASPAAVTALTCERLETAVAQPGAAAAQAADAPKAA